MTTLVTISRRTIKSIGITATALALPMAAQAQVYGPISSAEVQTLPPEYQTGPAGDYSETTIDANGVETVTRTRRIESTAPYQPAHNQPAAYPGAAPAHTAQAPAYAPTGYAPAGYAPAGYAPASTVFERDQWLDECEARTNGRGNREKGGIIGGLLGAIAGGIVGNRVSDAERLGGTLIGAGVGGLGGLLIGSLLGGGRDDRGNYDCEAALDSYLSQYGYGAPYPAQRVASRTIPAPAYQGGYYAAAPAYAPAYQSYGYTYAPPQQVVYVPVQVQQQQRVIVRETVREELVPGAARTIPAPAPRPVAQPLPAPRPVAQPRYIKGN